MPPPHQPGNQHSLTQGPAHLPAISYAACGHHRHRRPDPLLCAELCDKVHHLRQHCKQRGAALEPVAACLTALHKQQERGVQSSVCGALNLGQEGCQTQVSCPAEQLLAMLALGSMASSC